MRLSSRQGIAWSLGEGKGAAPGCAPAAGSHGRSAIGALLSVEASQRAQGHAPVRAAGALEADRKDGEWPANGRQMAGEWPANGRRSASLGRDSFLRIAPGPPGSASALSSSASAGSRRQPFACPSGRLLGGVSSEGVFGGGMAARCCFCMAGCAPFAWLPAPSAWRRASPALAMDVARLLACAWSCLAIASGKKTCFCGDHGS